MSRARGSRSLLGLNISSPRPQVLPCRYRFHLYFPLLTSHFHPMSRILAAMSGGVDSSVAAALLVRQGHDVVGAYMKNWINEENIIGHCPWQEDIEDARAVADQLGIEFRVVNLMK